MGFQKEHTIDVERMSYNPTLLDEWREEFDSWNYYLTGWWTGGLIISILHTLFWSLIGNLQWWLLLLIDFTILMIIPLIFTFISALKTYRWKIKTYKETGEECY